MGGFPDVAAFAALYRQNSRHRAPESDRATSTSGRSHMGRVLSVERAWARAGGPFATREVSGGDGIRLHACEWGNRLGPSILLVHGWSQSQLCWSRQITSSL